MAAKDVELAARQARGQPTKERGLIMPILCSKRKRYADGVIAGPIEMGARRIPRKHSPSRTGGIIPTEEPIAANSAQNVIKRHATAVHQGQRHPPEQTLEPDHDIIMPNIQRDDDLDTSIVPRSQQRSPPSIDASPEAQPDAHQS